MSQLIKMKKLLNLTALLTIYTILSRISFVYANDIPVEKTVSVKLEFTSGSVLYKHASDFEWHAAADDYTPQMNDLIQVQVGGKIRLAFEIIRQQKKLNYGTLEISRPYIFRIHSDIFKQLEFSEYPLDLVVKPNEEDFKNQKFPLADFQFAFKRALAVFNELQDKIEKVKKRNADEGFKYRQSNKTISWVSPKEGSIYILHEGEASIPLHWQHPNDPAIERFKVFIWPANKHKTTSKASTVQDHFLLNIRKEGKYKIQVTSGKHTWTSKPILVHVYKPYINLVEKAYLEDEAPIEKIKIRNPSDGTKIVTLKKNFQVKLSWSLNLDSLPSWSEIHLQIMDQDQKVRDWILPGNQESHSVALPGGDYFWHVSWKGRNSASTGEYLKAESSSHSFSITSLKDIDALSIQKLIPQQNSSKWNDTSIYIDL